MADGHADERGDQHLAVDGREERAHAHRAMLSHWVLGPWALGLRPCPKETIKVLAGGGVHGRRGSTITTMYRRHFLTSLPALALAPRLAAQAPGRAQGARPQSDDADRLGRSRSLKFYQGLFGMPIQARQGTTLFLRIGSGPQIPGAEAGGGRRAAEHQRLRHGRRGLLESTA